MPCNDSAFEDQVRAHRHARPLRRSTMASAIPAREWAATPPNKGMKQTKPSILELRSLSPVLDGPVAGPRNGRVGLALLRTNSRCLSRAAVTGSAQQPRAARPSLPAQSCLTWLGPVESPRSSARRELSASTCAGTAEAEGASLFSDAIAVASRCVAGSRRLLRASLFSDAFALEPASMVAAAGEPARRRRYHARGLAERVSAGQG